ncbi:dipeptide ABC transporter ATP-binding protein [Pseudochelatococcus sp. B33]
MNSTEQLLLDVTGLTLTVRHVDIDVVKNISFQIAPGEIVGIVGESGSGKTLAARSIMGLEPPPIVRKAGSIRYLGREITTMPPGDLRKIRGSEVGMVFQEPMTSLNPSMTVGRQLEEGLVLHTGNDAAKRRALIHDMLVRVGIDDPEQAVTEFPHQFSGGMRQRIMLASVMLLKPKLLIADEPTTALDAVVQRDVLELMVDLTRANNTAVLMISHDLAMVARYTHRVIVMESGRIVEEGRTETILQSPKHPYTRKLLAAMPRRVDARPAPSTKETPVVAVRDLVIEYPGRRHLWKAGTPKRALKGVSLDVAPGEVVAVVGGSGSGKTTLGRTIAGLLRPTEGSILFEGKSIARSETAFRSYRVNCQMVFQDPYSSLDPRMTIGQLVGEALRHAEAMSGAEKRARVREMLTEVGLDRSHAERYPHELSGGQRQRIAIARAIIRRPRFVIADEPVSALDVTVRAQVLDLLAELQQRHRFSCLFISHDLGVVEQVADRVIVMKDGEIIEGGTRDAVFDKPEHDYTRRLLSAIPALATTETGGVRLKWRFEDADAGPAPAGGSGGPVRPIGI